MKMSKKELGEEEKERLGPMLAQVLDSGLLEGVIEAAVRGVISGGWDVEIIPGVIKEADKEIELLSRLNKGYHGALRKQQIRNAKLEERQVRQLEALEATAAAMDGLYGGDILNDDPIPYGSLTPDRQRLLDNALEKVSGVLHEVDSSTSSGRAGR